METAKNFYNRQHENWVPWLEDKYLAYFGKNKTSYVAEDHLSKTKLTGDENINAAQDKVNKNITGQFEKGGVLEGVGNITSKEVFTRSERQGKGEGGSIL